MWSEVGFSLLSSADRHAWHAIADAIDATCVRQGLSTLISSPCSKPRVATTFLANGTFPSVTSSRKPNASPAPSAPSAVAAATSFIIDADGAYFGLLRFGCVFTGEAFGVLAFVASAPFATCGCSTSVELMSSPLPAAFDRLRCTDSRILQ